MQPEAIEKSYWHGEKYAPLTLKIHSLSMGKTDLTASFQTLIQLICGMVCQINQNDGLKLCGWVILTELDCVAHQTELVLSSIPVCSGFSMYVPLQSPQPLLLF